MLRQEKDRGSLLFLLCSLFNNRIGDAGAAALSEALNVLHSTVYKHEVGSDTEQSGHVNRLATKNSID